jgi:hypothetical protein
MVTEVKISPMFNYAALNEVYRRGVIVASRIPDLDSRWR